MRPDAVGSGQELCRIHLMCGFYESAIDQRKVVDQDAKE